MNVTGLWWFEAFGLVGTWVFWSREGKKWEVEGIASPREGAVTNYTLEIIS